MNRQIVRWALALGFLGSVAMPLQAELGSGLIDALVKKGVLTYQEGEDIRAEMASEYKSTPGGMLTYGSSAVKGLKLYGDARVRYQYDNERAQGNLLGNNAAGSDRSRSRYRFRARIGADYKFSQNWSAGVRLETEPGNARSTNSDFGNGFSGFDTAVGLGLVYLQYTTTSPELFGWSFADMFDLRMGKHLHPFYINGVNNFWWDSDTNPEGFSQQIGWKNVGVDGMDVTLRGGQYIYSSNDNAGTTRTNARFENDVFMFVAQLEGKYEWEKGHNVRVAPTYYGYTGGYLSGGAATIPGTTRATDLNHMHFFVLPMEVNIVAAERPLKFYGTFGLNMAEDRFNTSRNIDNTKLPIMFNVGATYGSTKKKGNWSITGEYRFVETGAYNPNLADSDFFVGNTNGHGPIASASYAFTDNIVGAVTYFHAWNVSPDLNISDTAALTSAQVLQVDLSWRF